MSGELLVVGHWNVFAGNPTPAEANRAIVAADCDSFGVNEGQRSIALFRALTRYRVVVAPGTGRDRETPILTRSSLRPLGTLTLQISAAVKGDEKWAPARWATVSMFAHPVARVAHINVHLNAQVIGVPTSTPRVREYAASTEALASLVRFLEREGFAVVVSGDVNVLNRDARKHPWTAQAVLEAIGLQTRTRGVDMVAWHDEQLRLADWQVDEPDHGSNHPLIVATFKARR